MTNFFARKVTAKLMMTSALVAAGSIAFMSPANAADYTLPTTPDVVGGSATVTTPSTGNMHVNQSTDRVIINWNTFNIGSDATVQFFQPGTNSLAVNRVTNSDQFTAINGKLLANGRVMILDPNGVMFGAGSIVDVGSIVASTGNINDAQVMNSANTAFELSNFGAGQVVNNGTITAANSGLVAFVAPTVKNNGIINANLGRVSLAAGSSTVTVDLYGDNLVELALSPVSNISSSYLSENNGTINAGGGKIQMTAQAAKDVVNSVVNMQGVLNANSASVKSNGTIVLSAGTVNVGQAPKAPGNGQFPAKAVKLAEVHGDTTINSTVANLGVTIDGKVSGSAKQVNVLSDAAKIGQALDVISANGTINVASGTYSEHLVVNKEGVTINGAQSGSGAADVAGAETIINPNSPGVKITANNVTIDGLTFENALNSDGYGIFVMGGNNAVLKNNTIRNVAQSGIYIRNASGVSVINNNIGATGGVGNIGADGIHVVNGNNITITGNTIANTSSPADEVGSGIYLQNTINSLVSGNTIYDVKWDGIKVKNGGMSTISGNTISNAVHAAIGASKTYALNILNNTGNSIAGSGIWSNANNRIAIDGNSLNNVGSYGVFSSFDNDTTISDNTVKNTGNNGIHAENASGFLRITGNNVGATGGAKNIKGDGIHLNFANGALVSGNTIGNVETMGVNIGSGIFAQNSNAVTISGNNIDMVYWDGIKLENGSGYTVNDNIITRVGRSFVSATNTAGSTISGNSGIHAGLWGMFTTLNNGLVIDNNDISIAWRQGIASYLDNDTTISNNTVLNSRRTGIQVRNNSGTTNIIGNTVAGTGDHGIYAVDTTGLLTISGNNVGATGGFKNIKADGIHLNSVAGALVSGNTIANVESNGVNMGSGIFAQNSNDVTISGNNIDMVYWDGIKLENGNNYVVNDNVISRVGRSFVSATNTTGSTISGNSGIHAGLWGMFTTLNDGLVIDNNDISTSWRQGIASYLDNNTTISNNTVMNSRRTGIQVRNNTGTNNITDNIVENSGDHGIYAVDTNGLLNITGNDVQTSVLNGIYLTGINRTVDISEGSSAYAVTISGNNVDNSAVNGVELSEVGGLVTIETNEITNSLSNGLVVKNAYSTSLPPENNPEARVFALEVASNPIDLHIVGNTILNTIGTGEGEGGSGVSGFAAVNLDIAGDGYAELSANILGDNFTYGIVAYSGLIDLTGASNSIRNTDIGLGFYPASFVPAEDSSEYFDELAAQLRLVGDTIGTTAFVDQSQSFVDLGYGAFFAPGSPTILNGNNATYTLEGVTIDPAGNGGFVTDAELAVLEQYINHYNDAQNRGLFFFTTDDSTLSGLFDQKDVFRSFAAPVPQAGNGSLTITGLPRLAPGAPTAPAATTNPAGAFNPNLIEPAAGDDSTGAQPQNVADIQPAAGGDAPTSACWADATASLGQGSSVTMNFGSSQSALLQNAVNCGSGSGGEGQAL